MAEKVKGTFKLIASEIAQVLRTTPHLMASEREKLIDAREVVLELTRLELAKEKHERFAEEGERNG